MDSRRHRPLRRHPSHLKTATAMVNRESPISGPGTPSTATPTNPSSRVSQAPAGSLCLNVLNVVFGDRLITPWYPSLYREELVTGEPVERLFVCERCFRYSRELVLGLAHRRFCALKDGIPGRVVYAKGRYSIYELDGEEHQLFTQNLSLFSKLFIENKSVCFDVTTFLYYLLVDNESDGPSAPLSTSPTHSPTSTSTKGASASSSSPQSKITKRSPKRRSGGNAASANRRPQIVGFFSKEKLSWDNNNLACILVFPPWQRLGLGQMLMGASYELARREGRLGGPERPLSALGKKSYLAYWTRAVAAALLAAPNKSRLSMAQLGDATYMIREDVVAALLAMEGVLGTAFRGKRDGEERVRLDKGRVRAWLASHGGGGAGVKPAIELDGFVDDDDGGDGGAGDDGDDEENGDGQEDDDDDEDELEDDGDD